MLDELQKLNFELKKTGYFDHDDAGEEFDVASDCLESLEDNGVPGDERKKTIFAEFEDLFGG
jgi:hypothetical protein